MLASKFPRLPHKQLPFRKLWQSPRCERPCGTRRRDLQNEALAKIVAQTGSLGSRKVVKAKRSLIALATVGRSDRREDSLGLAQGLTNPFFTYLGNLLRTFQYLFPRVHQLFDWGRRFPLILNSCGHCEFREECHLQAAANPLPTCG